MKNLILSLSVALSALWPHAAHAQGVIVPSPVPALTANCVLQANAAATLIVCNPPSAAAQPLTDGVGLIADNANPTKILAFELSNISPSTTRTITWPDANITVPSTIASLAANTFTGLQTLNGGLAATTGTFSSTLGVTGDFAINTNKFNVTAASGNTTIAGTLGVTGASTLAALSATTGTFSSTLGVTGDFAINTNKFNVTAASGNTTIAGTLGVTGATTLAALTATTGTFSSDVTLSAASAVVTLSGATTPEIIWTVANGRVQSNGAFIFGIDRDNNSSSESFFWRINNATDIMELKESGFLGVGASPAHPLHVLKNHNGYVASIQNSADNITNTPNGLNIEYTGSAPNGTGNYFLLAQDTGAQRHQLRANGGIGNWSANNVNLSDERTKNLTGQVESLREKFSRIKLYRGRYKDSKRDADDVMWTAQEIAAIDPNWTDVFQHEEKDDNGNIIRPFLLGTRDNQIFMANVAVTLEHESLIVGLQKAVADLQKRLGALEAFGIGFVPALARIH